VSPKSAPTKDRPRVRSAQDDDLTRIPPLESLTGFLLRRASNIADSYYYKHAGNSDITHRQFAILLSLQTGGSMTQAALSAATRMDRSTINEMVPRMLERGLISKSDAPGDKRAIHLAITDHGTKIVKELVPGTVLSQDMLLASLPKEYRRIFRHCLEIIIEANDADLSE